jgi:hypothetical protein
MGQDAKTSACAKTLVESRLCSDLGVSRLGAFLSLTLDWICVFYATNGYFTPLKDWICFGSGTTGRLSNTTEVAIATLVTRKQMSSSVGVRSPPTTLYSTHNLPHPLQTDHQQTFFNLTHQT